MKRYRIFGVDFDTRASVLKTPEDCWEEKIKQQHLSNRNQMINQLKVQYGDRDIENKINNFIELKSKPFSVIAFHNKFLEQVRNAYVIGSYYPALTGASALGERILNHMIILLRDYHKNDARYKRVYKKKSFDDWNTAIDLLESWDDLLIEAAQKFRDLHTIRNNSLHFTREIDSDDKNFSISAIHKIQEIIDIQFGFSCKQPWYLWIPGEIYLKKEWEKKPFVKEVIIPNSLLVGPNHYVESLRPHYQINDNFIYENKEISDEEFIQLRKNRN